MKKLANNDNHSNLVPSSKETLLELRAITKVFPRVNANDNISLNIHKAEVEILLGENGAGKATLMNILFGLYQSDKGELLINGQKLNFKSPNDAIKNGIGMAIGV